MLNVGYNKEITDLKFLLYQPDLVKFYCSCTGVKMLKPLQFCLHLKELKITNCAIVDPEELYVLRYLRKLLWCDITDNPMIRDPSFREIMDKVLTDNPMRLTIGLKDVPLTDY